MSNGINAPQGLQIVESAIGNGGTQKLKPYFIYADSTGMTTQPNSIFCGDAVKWNSNPGLAVMNGTIAPEYLSPPANRSAAAGFASAEADAFLGVFISCTYISAQTKLLTESNYWPGGTIVMPGTPIIAYVNDDPMAIFKIQISSSVANATGIIFLNASSGLNANLGVAGINFTDPVLALTQNPSTGNTRNGISAYYLDGSTIAVTETLDMKIIGLAPSVNPNLNPTGLIPAINMPFVDVLVKFNRHVYGSNGTAGYTSV